LHISFQSASGFKDILEPGMRVVIIDNFNELLDAQLMILNRDPLFLLELLNKLLLLLHNAKNSFIQTQAPHKA
jgi:hypothetical protein